MCRVFRFQRRARDYIRLYLAIRRDDVNAPSFIDIERMRSKKSTHRNIMEVDRLFVQSNWCVDVSSNNDYTVHLYTVRFLQSKLVKSVIFHFYGIFFWGVLDDTSLYCSRVVFTSLLPVVPYPHPSKIPPFRLHQTSCSSLYTNHQMLFFIRLTNFKQIVADKTFLSASFLSSPHSQIHCRLCPAITSEHCQTNQKCSQPLPLHPKPCRNAWFSQLFWESSRSHWHLLLRHCQ